MITLSITVRNEEQSLTQKHLIHQEGMCLSHDDVQLQRLVAEAQGAFGEGAEDVIVKVRYLW